MLATAFVVLVLQTSLAADAPRFAVSKPVQRHVAEYADFAGRTEAVQSVELRARVAGYLVRTTFMEGSEVKKGDLLFEIDPRPYEAQVLQAQSQVGLAEAQVKLAQATLARDKPLVGKGGVTEHDLERDTAAVDEAMARLRAARAGVDLCRLNLEFTKVVSPIDGRVGRYYVTVGNLVNQEQTLLTTIVSHDPMYVYFELDERTAMRLARSRRVGEARGGQLQIEMGLPDEEGLPHRGIVDFLNNRVNPDTGTITARGVFPNPRPAGGTWLLSPGMSVRVRLPVGEPRRALLVSDSVIRSEKKMNFVYTLDGDNKIQRRWIVTGPIQEDGLRVITQGLNPDDWVVVGNLQQARPDLQVQPQPTPMPTAGQGP
jgi:multidrug efflux system membrane fusion protein